MQYPAVIITKMGLQYCRRIKTSHKKKKGDEALKQGNFKQAVALYTEALEACPLTDKDVLKALYSNRSLAYGKCMKYHDALSDAEKAVKYAPTWAKGYWRKGVALEGLGRMYDATEAFYESWACDRGNKETEKKLRQTVFTLPDEQLGMKILDFLSGLELDTVSTMQQEENGATQDDRMRLIEPAKYEIAERVEMEEGAFQMVRNQGKKDKDSKTKTKQFHELYLDWLRGGVPEVYEAYLTRSKIYYYTKCYVQAQEDAKSALFGIRERHIQLENDASDQLAMRILLLDKAVEAYTWLGLAYLTEHNHPDKNAIEACKAFVKAFECGCNSQEVRDHHQTASESLTKEELEKALREACDEGHVLSETSHNLNVEIFTAECSLLFPQGKARSLTPAIRELLRQQLAWATSMPLKNVTIEGVRNSNGLKVLLHVKLGSTETSSGLIKSKIESLFSLDRSADSHQSCNSIAGRIHSSLGSMDVSSSEIKVVHAAPKHLLIESGPKSPSPEEKQIIVPSRPKMEVVVPYRSYSLVDARGNPVKRSDKHAFCMSRVYYDRTEIQAEVWVEIADGSCRWRQSGSEIKIIALKVPPNLPPRHLEIQFEPYRLCVKHKETGEVYLEGKLYRGIIPDDCFWTHLGGEGEDGCLISLTKMNLEVLKKHWMHSEMWWSKLFDQHGDIAWDDYEKDYSDLPEEVLEKHRIREAIKEEERQEENVDQKRRSKIQDADDLRKRKRQDRLRLLRDGRQ